MHGKSQVSVHDRLQKVVERIVEAYDPQQIVLFGSHVYGEPDADSDVDLLVVMESQERPAARATRISRLLRPRPFSMDIIVRTPEEIEFRLRLNDPFIGQILEQGRTLYERDRNYPGRQ